LETTIPATDIIEFGAIVLDKSSLFEKETYTTLIKSSNITEKSTKANGITTEMLKDAPTFQKVAQKIFQIMNGRIWAGHNISTFDISVLNKEFKKLSQVPPTSTGIIDTLMILRKTFGNRAGNNKLSSFAKYFQMGEVPHRSLEDCRINVEVLKRCSTILFLESLGSFEVNPPKKSTTRKSKKNTENKESTDTKKEVNEIQSFLVVSPKNKQTERKEISKPIEFPVKTTEEEKKIELGINNVEKKEKTRSRKKSKPTKELPPRLPGSPVVIEKLSAAMKEGKTIWMIYAGGTHGTTPRSIKPLNWVEEGILFEATSPNTVLSDKPWKYLAHKILEIQDTAWDQKVEKVDEITNLLSNTSITTGELNQLK